MRVEQIYTLMNAVTREILGQPTEDDPSIFVLKEDLSNVVDMGKALFDATSVDNYVRTLVDVIGRVKVVDRLYVGSTPSLLKENWQFGSVLEKLSITELPEAQENESWNLQSGTSYDPNVFKAPKVEAKFFNSKLTIEIDMSFTDKQVRESFTSASQLNAFISAIYTAIQNSFTVKMDALFERAINNMIGQTLNAEYGAAAYGNGTHVKAVNLLYLYNNTVNYGGTPLTAAASYYSADFIRFATLTIKKCRRRLKKMSTLFNVGGMPRFTPDDRLHMIMLADFSEAADVYLQSDTYHNELVSLGSGYEVTPFWQASGSEFAIDDVSAIKIEIDTGSGSSKSITCTGIIGVMFDDEAVMVANLDERVTANYNPKGEFTNEFWKKDVMLVNDLDENFVVFFIADPSN